MRIRTASVATTLLLTLCFSAAAGSAAEPPNRDFQIASALAAAPPDMGETATVLGYAEGGRLVTLREGTGELVCVADDPAEDRFHAACYHKSLEPFMARGRELKAEGVGGAQRHRIRHEEIDAGKLEMPKAPTALFSVTGAAGSFDPATGKVRRANRVYVVYMPYATEESTGLPPRPDPDQPSAPWIMRTGTASAHVMITPGPEDVEESEDQ